MNREEQFQETINGNGKQLNKKQFEYTQIAAFH